ncbi:MAG: hypothetical protein Q9181_008332, partial [Wetmoreana brouardii]
MARLILTALASLAALSPTLALVEHDSFKRTACYCVSEPSSRDPFIAELRYKEYYNAALDQGPFILNDTCIDH